MLEVNVSQIPFFVTMPHSGEKVPEICPWLKDLPEEILMSDVDRFVDQLYEPALQKLSVPYLKTDWHRYAVDLNRNPSDIDESSVVGAKNKAGAFTRGFHWVKTYDGADLMQKPMDQKTHEALTHLIHDPFHAQIKSTYENFHQKGFKNLFHVDAHSMPSLGTLEHRDPGQTRAEIVVSDCYGKSCHQEFRDLVIVSYVMAGFKVGFNWPYFGGRLTERYGEPDKGHHVIQVELSRGLYMNEQSKKRHTDIAEIQSKLQKALAAIQSGLAKLKI
jgi:N-formylglutamate deformylase